MTAGHHRGRHRGRALRRDLHRPHRPPPQAGLRGVQALRARRRPAGRRRCRAAHRRPAGPPRGRHAPRPASPRSSPRPHRAPSRCRPTTPTGSPVSTYGRETVVRRLQQVGCDVYGQDELIVTVPSWRPDLAEPNDLAEEVIRLEGYENLPVHPAEAALRPRAHRPPAAAPPRRPGAGRRRLRRGAELPVHRRRRPRPARPGAGRRPPPHGHASSTRSPTRSPRCAPRCCRACSAHCGATTAAAAHDLALFETGLVFRPTGEETDGRTAARRPPSHRRGDRRTGRGAPASAAPRRRRPRGRPRAGRLVGQGPPRRLGGRRRGGAHHRP